LVGGEQSTQLTDKTKEHLTQNNVPPHVIAMYESTENENDTSIKNIAVWLENKAAFFVFCRNLSRWQYVNKPVGMGTMSVPCQWDWQHAERCMNRMPEIRAMTALQLDELYLQLEVMERSALNEFNQQFKKLKT